MIPVVGRVFAGRKDFFGKLFGPIFAGGFVGYLSRCGSIDNEHLRRAMMYGSALGSFSVERMGVERLIELKAGEVHERVRHFHAMTTFEHPVASLSNV